MRKPTHTVEWWATSDGKVPAFFDDHDAICYAFDGSMTSVFAFARDKVREGFDVKIVTI